MRTVVLISANSEWRAVKEILYPAETRSTPLGEFFTWAPTTGELHAGTLDTGARGVVTRDAETNFFHGSWGKVSAAATAQYAIDRFQPDLLVNLGTCGGFEGQIERGAIILVTKTVLYDILEQMSDPDEAIAEYSTELDLSWLDETALFPARRGVLLSADRDIVPADIPWLSAKYGAAAADWESGAIAWVAKRNGVRCLILRGVSDLVGPSGGEAYGNIELFHKNTHNVMKTLLDLFRSRLSYLTGGESSWRLSKPSLPVNPSAT